MNLLKPFALFVFLFSTFVQTISQEKKLRNSMTLLVAKYNTNPTNAYYYADKVDVPNMFDDNSFGDNVLRIDGSQSADNSYTIQKALASSKIAQKILKTIFYDEKAGKFSTAKMFERGEYTATDVDFLIAKDSKLKEAALKDMGLQLMNNIYVQVYDCASYIDVEAVTTEATRSDISDAFNDSKLKALSGTAILFKLDIEQMLTDNSFWNLIDFENNDYTKRENFNNFVFNFKKVSNTNFTITESQRGSAALSFLSSLAKVDQSSIPLKSEKELMTSMMAKAVNKSTTTLCGHLANFEISQSVFSTNPIAIKVGKKESLRRNALYEITEKVADKTGRISVNHVAWVRAKSVSDNKSKSQGKSIPSTFYKVSGSSIQKGMLAKYNPEKGFEVTAGFMEGNTLFSGGFIEVTKYLGIPKTRYGLKMNFGGAKTDENENPWIADRQLYFNSTNGMLELFMNHSINVAMITIVPKVGLYYSMTTFTSYDEKGRTNKPMSDWGSNSNNIESTSIGLSTGVNVGFNFGKSMQLSLRYESGLNFATEVKEWNLRYGGYNINPTFGSRSSIGLGFTFWGF